ncbi:MAG: hypothetical protein AAF090_07800 [Bacteroidota bacterium]
MLDKKIYRYTPVELLDTIRNSKDTNLVEQAKAELAKRALSEAELQKLEIEYTQYKDFQAKRKDEPLTREEWLTLFFIPYSSSGGPFNNKEFAKEEAERYEKYGYETKKKQAAEAQLWGTIFWIVVVLVIAVLFKYFNIRI